VTVFGTDGDFFVTVDPRNWKRLKEEEEDLNMKVQLIILNSIFAPHS
jgi:hypothetical protein